ncbi:MAG: hypothetical protein IPF53_05485 [Blastocatellia bacterium]|nr:hypothetical protein [Blastocatellia bacterium]
MGAEAAKAFLEAAAGAQPSERLDLERLAAEKYISSGYIDEGLAVLRSVLARIGIGLPGNPLSSLVGLIFYSLLVSLRGYRFDERPAERLSNSELLRVDTCWSVVLGFSMVDPVRHVYFPEEARAIRAGRRGPAPGCACACVRGGAAHRRKGTRAAARSRNNGAK